MDSFDSDAVERTIRIDASPETVFSFLVDPVQIIRWLGLESTLDPRPGGEFRVDMNGRDIVSGEIIEVEHNRRIVFTWGWENPGSSIPPGSTTVEITLEPDGDGTLLRLRHSGLRGPDIQRYDEGWPHYLDRLAMVAQGGDPGPDPLGTPDTHHT